MFIKKFSLLSWNVRGLGSDEKCNIVRNTIKSARSDVVLLQETKCSKVDCFFLSKILPNYFDSETVFNLAIHTSGGILIAWRRSFRLLRAWSTKHAVTAVLLHVNYGNEIIVTNVYGPTDDDLKPQFILELRAIAQMVDKPWILAGDFNQVRWIVDRSAANRSFNLMDLYNDFIMDTELVDVPLRNRTYTWSNKRPQPVFSRIDRVFTTNEWAATYPMVTLEAREVVVSDHAPLILTCKGLHQVKKQFRLECFWFKYAQPKAMVAELWSRSEVDQQTILTFHHNTEILHRALKIWHASTFGSLDR